MAIIRSLAVNVTARTKQFESGMKRSSKSTKGFRKGILDTTKSLIPFKLGLAAAGAAAVIMVKQQLSAIDSLAKTADKLGTTTEALAGFRLAAELTGVSVNTADMALQRMVRRLAEAAQGTGESKAALEELGLSAQRLSQLAPTAAFAEIAEAMKNVTNQADRVRLSFKLFDSEGVALVNTLKLGKAGLADVQKEAEQLGLAISRVDAAKVEDANDAITRFKSSLSGMGSTIAVQLADPLERVANILSTKGGRALAQILTGATLGAVLKGGKGGFIGAGIAATPVIADISGTVGKAIADVISPVTTFREGSQRLSDLGRFTTPELEKQLRLIKTTEDAIDKLDKLSIQASRTFAFTSREQALRKQRKEELRADIARLFSVRKEAMKAREREIERIGPGTALFRSAAIDLGETIAAAARTMFIDIPAKPIANLGRAFVEQAEAAKRLVVDFAAATVSANKFADEIFRLADIGKSVFDRTRTPLENFRKEMQGLRQLFEVGAIDLDTFLRAGEQAFGKLPGPDAVTGPSFVRNPALEAGSNAAFDAIQRAIGVGAQSEQKKQTGELKKQTGFLGAIDQNTRDLGEPETVGIV